MKKTFLTKRNALLSSTDVSWGAYALMGAVLFLFVRLLTPNFFWQIFTPVFKSADFVAETSHAFFSSFNNAAVLTLQNEKLQEENAALALENQTLIQKAASLGALANPTSGITVGVVARPPESPYDTLVLAAGTRAGVTLGMEAFGAGNVPIGIITSVFSDFSRATLFSSPGVATNGWVGQKGLPAQAGVSLTMRGSGAGAISASLARSAGITAGDTVFAPGPGQLPIGKVVRVDSDPSSPSVTLRIQPASNPFSTSWVTLRDVGTTLRGAILQATSTLP